MMRHALLILWLTALGLMGWSMLPLAPADESQPDDGSGPLDLSLGTPQSQPEGSGANRPTFSPMPLTDTQRQQVLSFLQAEQADLFTELQQAKKADAVRYELMLQRLARPTLYLVELKRANPELYGLYLQDLKIGREVARLTEELRQAADPVRRSELVSQVRVELVRRFDVSQERQRLQIAQFGREVQRLESMLQMRRVNKDKIIEQQLKAIIEAPANGNRP